MKKFKFSGEKMTHRLMIFIPTYNCAKQLPRVLEKIDTRVKQFVEEVVIIDNQSTDKTIHVAIEATKMLNFKTTILRNKENYSLGGSIKCAFLYAMENGYDYMITLHGDDQADIRDLLPALESNDHKNHDLIIGARFHPASKLKGYSLVRIMGNKILNFVCALINRRRVDDLIAGINCFKIDFFRSKFFLRFPNNLTFDVHLLLYAFSKRANIKYIPITWREEDQISNAKLIKQTCIILRLFKDYIFLGEKVFESNRSDKPENFMYESEVIFSADQK